MSVADNIARVRGDVAEAAIRAGRDPGEVTVVAVSKTHPASAVEEALTAGIMHLGENRVQEAEAKIPDVHRDGIWHLIGHLQSNKTGKAAELFDWIDSIDSVKIADTLDRHLKTADRTMNVLIQVNISGEEVKSGIELSAVPDLVRHIASLGTLRLRGLMTIGAFGADRLRRREEFVRMRRLFDDTRAALDPGHAFDVLSMGMSDDYADAVAEGSTMVRVGTAIFGGR